MSSISRWFDGLIPAKYASGIRILFYVYVFLFFFSYPNSGYAHLSADFWQPTGLAHVFGFLSPPFSYFEHLNNIWLVSLVCSALGLCSKVSKVLAFLGFIFLGTYDQHFGLVIFSGVPLVFILFYLIFLQDQFYSLDRWVFQKLDLPAFVPAWPILCFQIFQIFLYVVSSLQKFRLTGVSWLAGESMRAFISAKLPEPFLSWGLMIAATGAVLIELTAPLVFNKRWGVLYILALLMFHVAGYWFLHVDDAIWCLVLLSIFVTRKMEPSKSQLF
jgi:hypothetical protein